MDFNLNVLLLLDCSSLRVPSLTHRGSRCWYLPEAFESRVVNFIEDLDDGRRLSDWACLVVVFVYVILLTEDEAFLASVILAILDELLSAGRVVLKI